MWGSNNVYFNKVYSKFNYSFPMIWRSREWFLIFQITHCLLTITCISYEDIFTLYSNYQNVLSQWGRMTHICVDDVTIIGSDNGLSPGRRQAIIGTNAGILFIEPTGTNFSEILIEIQTFSFKKMRLKVPSAKWRPFCLGLNVLILRQYD